MSEILIRNLDDPEKFKQSLLNPIVKEGLIQKAGFENYTRYVNDPESLRRKVCAERDERRRESDGTYYTVSLYEDSIDALMEHVRDVERFRQEFLSNQWIQQGFLRVMSKEEIKICIDDPEVLRLQLLKNIDNEITTDAFM